MTVLNTTKNPGFPNSVNVQPKCSVSLIFNSLFHSSNRCAKPLPFLKLTLSPSPCLLKRKSLFLKKKKMTFKVRDYSTTLFLILPFISRLHIFLFIFLSRSGEKWLLFIFKAEDWTGPSSLLFPVVSGSFLHPTTESASCLLIYIFKFCCPLVFYTFDPIKANFHSLAFFLFIQHWG